MLPDRSMDGSASGRSQLVYVTLIDLSSTITLMQDDLHIRGHAFYGPPGNGSEGRKRASRRTRIVFVACRGGERLTGKVYGEKLHDVACVIV